MGKGKKYCKKEEKKSKKVKNVAEKKTVGENRDGQKRAS